MGLVTVTVTGGLPDVVIDALRWSDNDGARWHLMTEPVPVGRNILFQVDVRNQGTSATPNGVILGVLFMVNTGAGFAGVSWTDTRTAPVAPGESVTLTANGGPDGDRYWVPASVGGVTIRAWVDDPNRFPEANEGNNILDVPVTVFSPGGGGLQPPAQAAAAGYTRLVFQEEFDDYSGIDVGDTRQPGFKFYRFLPFGEGVNPMSNIVVANSVLTLRGGPTYNMALTSTAGIASNQWVGFAARGGAYFEASIAFDLVQSAGWPSFWMMAAEHLWGNATGWIEFDVFEKWDASQGFYINAAHWWGQPGGDRHTQFSPPVPPGWNWSEFHVHGGLWLPGDRWRWYRDDQYMGERTYAAFPWLAQGDPQSWPVILGSHTWPMRVDWVRVWARP